MQSNVNANEAVLAIEVVENSKVDINIVHDEVVSVSTFMNKGKGKALEVVEEKDEAAASVSFTFLVVFYSNADMLLNSPLHLKKISTVLSQHHRVVVLMFVLPLASALQTSEGEKPKPP